MFVNCVNNFFNGLVISLVIFGVLMFGVVI